MGTRIQGWLRRLTGVRRSQPLANQDRTEAGPALLNIEGVNFVFGMDWRMVPSTRRISRALALGRQEGMAWFATSELQDIVGFLRPGLKARGPQYSAPLHLASRFAQGGLELFAFSFPMQRYAVLALQDFRPLPGYDVLGPLDVVKPMIEEFLAIQRGQPIRLVGNIGFLEGQETVSPEDLFAEPARSARLRSLRSPRALLIGTAVVIAAGIAMTGVERLLDARRKATLAELHASSVHQQKLYDDGLTRAWANLPDRANVLISGWLGTVAGIPLLHRGWKLERLECGNDKCSAVWTRLHGSYGEFMADLPKGVGSIDESAADQETGTVKLTTHHPVSRTFRRSTASQADLPDQLSARRELTDLFLDLKLLGESASRIEPFKLFGGDQDPKLLSNAVYAGQWSLRQALWVLPSLELPSFVQAHSLTIEIEPTTGSTAHVRDPGKPDGQFSEPVFLLTGTYHARN